LGCETGRDSGSNRMIKDTFHKYTQYCSTYIMCFCKLKKMC
jgi:hypothetical protein